MYICVSACACVCARAHTHMHAEGKKEEGFIDILTTPVSARVRVIVTRMCVYAEIIYGGIGNRST